MKLMKTLVSVVSWWFRFYEHYPATNNQNSFENRHCKWKSIVAIFLSSALLPTSVDDVVEFCVVAITKPEMLVDSRSAIPIITQYFRAERSELKP